MVYKQNKQKEIHFLIIEKNLHFLMVMFSDIYPLVENIKPPLRVIPQGTVDNNLGLDHLAGTKALDPNYCRQPTL